MKLIKDNFSYIHVFKFVIVMISFIYLQESLLKKTPIHPNQRSRAKRFLLMFITEKVKKKINCKVNNMEFQYLRKLKELLIITFLRKLVNTSQKNQ